MGTIHERTGRDGKVTYRAQDLRKRGQATLNSEARTFSRRRDAEGWIKRTEKTLDGVVPISFAMRHATVASVIERYLGETRRKVGRTKAQCLRTIAAMDFGSQKAVDADQAKVIDLMATLRQTLQPQTVANHIAHLSSIYTIARPAYLIVLRAGEPGRCSRPRPWVARWAIWRSLVAGPSGRLGPRWTGL